MDREFSIARVGLSNLRLDANTYDLILLNERYLQHAIADARLGQTLSACISPPRPSTLEPEVQLTKSTCI
jgi:hypothetical protein